MKCNENNNEIDDFEEIKNENSEIYFDNNNKIINKIDEIKNKIIFNIFNFQNKFDFNQIKK